MPRKTMMIMQMKLTLWQAEQEKIENVKTACLVEAQGSANQHFRRNMKPGRELSNH